MSTISDFAIVVATLGGPVLAVQAQKWLERGRAIDDRRRQIFRILMANRATTLSPANVEAINSVPVEFFSRRNVKLKKVTDAWHSHLDTLSITDQNPEIVGLRRIDSQIELLFQMSNYLGYGFSKSDINKDVYRPTGHVDIETEQTVIRQGLANLFSGKAAIPMAVKEFPVNDDALARQGEIQTLLVEWLNGNRAVKVSET